MLRTLIVALALFAVPMLAAADAAEDNVATLLRFYDEAVNTGNMELFDAFMAENFVEHEELPGLSPTREGVKQWFTMLREAFPDVKFDVEFTVAQGDKVAAYVTMTGTQAKEFMGIPSHGNAFSVKMIDILQFENGKAVAHWGVVDTGVMMEQLAGEVSEGK